MSPVHNHDDIKRKEKSNLYFLLALFFLLAMGFVWSLDASLVYITFGAAIFFLFLGIWNRPRSALLPDDYPKKKETRKREGESSQNELKNVLREILTSKKIAFPEQSRRTPSSTDKKFMSFVFFFIFLVFTSIFLAVIFSERINYSDNAISYYQTGEQFRWEGEYDSAARYYKLALSVDPEYPEALTGYGNVLLAMTKYDSALAILDKALEVNPDYEYASYSKALVYYYQKKYRPSLEELFKLLDKSPAYYDAMVLAGDDYYLQQQYDSAIYWYEEGYSNGVRSAGLCHVMGFIYDEQGDDQKAIRLYQEALSYDSTRVDVFTRLGELFPGMDGEVYRKTARKLKSEGY